MTAEKLTYGDDCQGSGVVAEAAFMEPGYGLVQRCPGCHEIADVWVLPGGRRVLARHLHMPNHRKDCAYCRELQQNPTPTTEP